MATLEKQIGSRSGDKKPGEIGSRRSPLRMQSYTMGPPLIHEGSEPVGPESKAYGHTVRQRGSRVVGRAEWFMVGSGRRRLFRRFSLSTVCNGEMKLFFCLGVGRVDMVRYGDANRVCAGRIGCIKCNIHDGIQDNHARRPRVRADCPRKPRCIKFDLSVRRNQTHVCRQVHPLGCRKWVVRHDERQVKLLVRNQLPRPSYLRPVGRRHQHPSFNCGMRIRDQYVGFETAFLQSGNLVRLGFISLLVPALAFLPGEVPQRLVPILRGERLHWQAAEKPVLALVEAGFSRPSC